MLLIRYNQIIMRLFNLYYERKYCTEHEEQNWTTVSDVPKLVTIRRQKSRYSGAWIWTRFLTASFWPSLSISITRERFSLRRSFSETEPPTSIPTISPSSLWRRFYIWRISNLRYPGVLIRSHGIHWVFNNTRKQIRNTLRTSRLTFASFAVRIQCLYRKSDNIPLISSMPLDL